MARRKNKTLDQNKIFSRRSFVIGGIQASLLGALGTRLGYLQLSQGEKYKTLSDRNRINIKLIAPSRGEITDRYGVPLAINNRDFRAVIIREQTDDIVGSLIQTSKFINLSDKRIKKIIANTKRTAKYVPVEIASGLSWEDVARLEVNLTDLPGIQIETGEVRSYPYSDSTAHIVGYVGAISKSELSRKDSMLSLPGLKTGKTGIERKLEKDIRGELGRAEVEVNVSGREVRELSRVDEKSGERTVLTIDAELQRFVQKRLETEKSASAVVMDAKTGEIYAMVSHPSFDPNLFVTGLSVDKWQELISSETHPLNNKAVMGQYPPGSTFKMITALAGLEMGIINRHSKFDCPGYYDFGDNRFHCWKRNGHGSVNVISALSESCDTFFYKISTKIGIDNIAKMARRFGLGQKYNFELLEEKAGLMPDKDWKMGRGEKWYPGETIISSIGQGSILSTPLQLATMTARLVNGGYDVTPWIISHKGNNKTAQSKTSKIKISKNNLNIVLKGMHDVVNSKKGTAKASEIDDDEYRFGGKTGTAQVKRISREDRRLGLKNSDLPWKYRHHALFTGYAPTKNPRYVCAVIVEHGGGGSSTAAPIARDILLETQKRAPARTKQGKN